MNTELLSSLASIGLSNVDKTSKECEHPVQFSEIDIYTDKFVHVFYYHLIFEQTISHLDTVRSFIHDTEIESVFRDSVKEFYLFLHHIKASLTEHLNMEIDPTYPIHFVSKM